MAPFGWFDMIAVPCSTSDRLEFRDTHISTGGFEHDLQLHANAERVVADADDVGCHSHALDQVNLSNVVGHGRCEGRIHHLMHDRERVETAAAAGLTPFQFGRKAMRAAFAYWEAPLIAGPTMLQHQSTFTCAIEERSADLIRNGGRLADCLRHRCSLLVVLR